MCNSGREIYSMLALIPQSGDFSGATLGVRSVALLQVAKPTACLRGGRFAGTSTGNIQNATAEY